MKPSHRIVPATAWATLVLVLGISVGLAQSLKASLDKSNQANASVKGSVKTVDGKPANGAVVYIQYRNAPGAPWGLEETKTDTSGRFSFAIPADDSFALLSQLKKDQVGAFGSLLGEDKLKADSTLRNIPIQLVPARTVKLVALDKVGNSIPNLTVGPERIYTQGQIIELSPDLCAKLGGVTDSKGYLNIGGVPAMPMLSLATPDPRYARDLFEHPGGLPPYSSQKIEAVVVRRACEIDGAVTWDGKPVKGVVVRDSEGRDADETVSDVNGHFKFERAPEGPLRLISVLPPELRDEYIVRPVHLSTTSTNPTNVEIKLEKGGLIYGKVRADGHIPAANIYSQVLNVGPRRLLDESPRFQADGSYKVRLPAGYYEINVFDGGESGGVSNYVTVKDGDTKQVTLKAPSEKGFAVTTVKVIDADGHPRSRQPVEYSFGKSHLGYGRMSVAVTNDQGEAKIIYPQEVASTLNVNAKIGDQFSTVFKKPENGLIVLKLHHIHLVAAEGFVRGAASKPISGASVMLHPDGIPHQTFYGDPDYGVFNQTSDTNGHFLTRGIYPNSRTRFLVRAEGYADTMTPIVQIGSGDITAVPPVILQPSAKIMGKVVDQNGKPIAGAQILAEGVVRETHPESRTDRNGIFLIDRIPAGTFKIGIYKGTKEIRVRAKTGTNEVYRLNL